MCRSKFPYISILFFLKFDVHLSVASLFATALSAEQWNTKQISRLFLQFMYFSILPVYSHILPVNAVFI
jgi:hypothetical protein